MFGYRDFCSEGRMEILLKLIIVPLIAAGASHFWGAKSNQKRLSSEMLLCRTRPLRWKSGKTWAANYCPFLPLRALAWQNLLCPSRAQGHHCFT